MPCSLSCCSISIMLIINKPVNAMLWFVLIALVAVSLRVHSKYSPGLSCQFVGHALIVWLPRIPSCELGCAFQPESLQSGAHHIGSCSAASVGFTVGRRSIAKAMKFMYPCNLFHSNKELICSMPTVSYSRRLVLGLEYGVFRFSLSRGATRVGIRARLAIGYPSA